MENGEDNNLFKKLLSQSNMEFDYEVKTIQIKHKQDQENKLETLIYFFDKSGYDNFSN